MLPYVLGAGVLCVHGALWYCMLLYAVVCWCVVVCCSVNMYEYVCAYMNMCVHLWCGVVWCGVVWCGVVWCGVV